MARLSSGPPKRVARRREQSSFSCETSGLLRFARNDANTKSSASRIPTDDVENCFARPPGWHDHQFLIGERGIIDAAQRPVPTKNGVAEPRQRGIRDEVDLGVVAIEHH